MSQIFRVAGFVEKQLSGAIGPAEISTALAFTLTASSLTAFLLTASPLLS